MLSRTEQRAALWSLLTQALPLAFGPLTIYVMVTRYDEFVQGTYYTFTNLASLIVLFQLGDQETVAQRLNAIRGRTARTLQHEVFVSYEARITRALLLYRATTSLLFILILGLAGAALIIYEDKTSNAQIPIWLIYAVGIAVNSVLASSVAVLIGRGDVEGYWRLRTIDYSIYSVTLIASLANGLGMWSLPLALGVTGAFYGYVFLKTMPPLLATSKTSIRREASYYWRGIFPAQLRIGLQNAVATVMPRLLVPVLFTAAGVIEAGRAAISLTLAMLAQAVSMLLLRIAMPRVTSVVNSGEPLKGRRIFAGAAGGGIAVYLLLMIGVVVALHHGEQAYPAIAMRFLSAGQTTLLFAAFGGLVVVAMMSQYLRIRLQDFPASLTIGGSVAILAASTALGLAMDSSLGVLIGFGVAIWCIYLPACAYYVFRV